MANMIRNISQSVQEREIVKTAPDLVCYLDGLPYLRNYLIGSSPSELGDAQKPNSNYTLVNFNDHVTVFNASYDIDLMVPQATIGLQVPNYQKHLYQMPGGNNLVETMMQVQVYAKGYYLSSQGDTVYRRVFKGIVSHIGYNDNGKTLEISLQCYGSLYLLELMQINLNPSVNAAIQTGSAITPRETIFGDHNPYRILADAFVYGLQSDGFQLDTLLNRAVGSAFNSYTNAVQRHYIAKWQSILTNMVKDVHIYGSAYSTPQKPGKGANQQKDPSKPSSTKGSMNKDELADSVVHHIPITEADDVAGATFYAEIGKLCPFASITGLQLTNNNIVNRLELIRRIIGIIGFEGYQDIDGKIIIKPPLYNLDILDLGSRSAQQSTSAPSPLASKNSQTNDLTQIFPETNPFVIYLSEILTENETEDQANVRRTRTTIVGALTPQLPQVDLPTAIKTAAEYIDIAKLAKFGLREEPAYMVPWLTVNDQKLLFAAAVNDTVRANRGYRTYTFTIPMRPELRVGFPVFLPHKDMYAYIKNIAVQYQVGSTATMTVTCDSLRRRILVRTPQKTNDTPPREYDAFVTAPNLVYKWVQEPPQNTQPQTNQSQLAQAASQTQAQQSALGATKSNANANAPVGAPGSVNNAAAETQTSPHEFKVHTYYNATIRNAFGNKADTATANWVVQNDTEGLFTAQRIVEKSYFDDLRKNLPYTDGKGYEVLAPFPWGRFIDLNSAIKGFTQMGWLPSFTDLQGNPVQDAEDLRVLQNTDAFIFAGLGTPMATGDTVSSLNQALQNQQTLVGGTLSSNNQTNVTTSDATGTLTGNLDATVIVLKYDGQTANDSKLLDTAQPEDALAQGLIKQLTNVTEQRLIDVLVSGTVAPTEGTQEALLATKTQTPTKLVQLNPQPGE